MKYKKLLAILTSALVLASATAFANPEEADIATPDVVVSEETETTEETVTTTESEEVSCC